MKATQKDIANALKVSRVAVSKALRRSPDISAELADKVSRLADELGYIPDQNARNLFRKKTHTLGVIIPDIANSFFSYAVYGIMSEAEQAGYSIILVTSRESAELEKAGLSTLLSLRVDGLLVAVAPGTAGAGVFDIARKNRTPLVFFDRMPRTAEFSGVAADDRQGARDLMEMAIRRGYRRIVHFSGGENVSVSRDRREGFLSAMKENGLPVLPESIAECGLDEASGYRACREILRGEPKPECIFAVNDLAAQGVYRALREVGLSIPRDIAVAAMGHKRYADIMTPALTIMDTQPELLGKTAMELLLEEIRDPEGPKRIVLVPPIFRENESLGASPKEQA